MTEQAGTEGAAPSAAGGGAPVGAAPTGGQPQVVDQESADNPAWAELLAQVPSQFHSLVKPHLQKWDQGVQQKFQQVHSQYEPWKQFMDAGLSPDEIGYALNILGAINENPQQVYEALGQHLGLQQMANGSESEQGAAEDETQQDEYVDPRIQQLEENYKTLAQITLAQHQEKEEAQADRELDEYLGELKTKMGDYDEQYVLALMGAGMDGEQAVQKYQELVQNAQTNARRPPAPTIMGPGGGQPSQQINPAKLDGKGRQALVASMLQAAAEQKRQ